ncbi:MAG: glutamate--tRNA ligase [Candidatus Nanoarchaeia archaeon]|nr:glutamate--tRNA ligase [Candidatus Nanoarchaeia archaeon]
MKGVKETILKFVLQNFVRYGKAEIGPIVGKVIGEHPDMKSKTKELVKEISEVVKEVNKMKKEEAEAKLKKLDPKLLEKKEEKEKVLDELKDAVKGKVVMRFAPSPSGALHIGHAYILLLSSEYCRKYNGKLILRIEDTNPENINPQAYNLIPEEAKWVTKGNVAQVIIQSDRIENYYGVVEKLISKGHAYVCECDAEAFRELSIKKEACPCRNLSVEDNHHRWDEMFTSYEPGEAVVRLKTDIEHKNPALRDFPLARINHNEHPMQGTKFKVWPLMNLSVAVDDYDTGITHTIRGKDHMDNERKQHYIFEYMGWKEPVHMYAGRINFKGLNLSASETAKMISYKKYSGWDDIRLPFLSALKRRGYTPEAFVTYALEVGLNETDKSITAEDFYKMLNHANKAIVENANRYFFIEKPKKIKIKEVKSMKVDVPLHVGHLKRGSRTFNTNDEFYIQDALKTGKNYRLMHLFNFKNKKFTSEAHNPDLEAQLIHWLPVSKDLIEVELVMPDGKVKKGLGELMLKHVKEGEVVQFERVGFVRLDKKEKNKLIFWYAHR